LSVLEEVSGALEIHGRANCNGEVCGHRHL
jgi:hypothetical protein